MASNEILVLSFICAFLNRQGDISAFMPNLAEESNPTSEQRLESRGDTIDDHYLGAQGYLGNRIDDVNIPS